MRERERGESSPDRLEKQSTFSRLSKGVSGVFSYSLSGGGGGGGNENNNSSSFSYSSSSLTQQQRLTKSNSSRNFNKSSPLKIEELFDSHFSKSKEELLQIIEPRPNSIKSRRNIEPTTIEELRVILKTMLEEIETLKYKCIVVENRYKEATITASRELQESMNILFKLQQKTASLEDSSKTVEKLTHEIK